MVGSLGGSSGCLGSAVSVGLAVVAGLNIVADADDLIGGEVGDPEYDRIVGGGQLGVVGGAGAVVSDVNQLVARAGLQAVHGDHNAHLGLGLIAGPGSIQHEGLVVLAGQAIDDNAVLLVGLKADGIGNFAAGGNLLNDGIADSVHNAHSRVGLLFGDRDGGISSDVLGHLNSLGKHDALVGGVQDVGGQLVGQG